MTDVRTFGHWDLVGRVDELETLWAALSEHRAAGVLLTGDAGVGKTRIANELLERARVSGRPVRRVTATRALTPVAFGAVAPLLPSANEWNPVTEDPRTYVESLAAEGGLVLVIDDVHLLDDASAELVRELCEAGSVFTVMTTRIDAPLHYAIEATIEDRHAMRMRVQPLSGDETVALVLAAFGGAVEDAMQRRLRMLTVGNGLYLRELLLSGLEQRRIVEHDGEWRWLGDIIGQDRLLELVTARLGALSELERDVVETLTLVEPIGLSVLRSACSLKAVAAADRRGMIRLETDGRRTNVRLAHTMHGDVMRPLLTAQRCAQILERMIGVIAEFGAHRREDTLRLSMWRVGNGTAR